MIKKKADEIRVFFAWQSDLPEKFTRFAIRDAIKAAVKKIAKGENGEVYPKKIVLDEAVRGVSGAPNIPEEIRKKILACDIFVGDVSIVRKRPNKRTEGMPNSNVVFELGFAAATLGWERVILPMNEVYGRMEQLPFDFDRHRATPFRLSASEGGRADLALVFQSALSLVIKNDPRRPSTDKFDVGEAQRQRDITNLRWLLGSLHWASIEQYIRSGPESIAHVTEDFFEEALAKFNSHVFHIYDEEVASNLSRFFGHWSNSAKYDHYTPSSTNPYIYKFTWSESYTDRLREQRHWDYMKAERLEMHSAIRDLLRSIRRVYPEIDIRAESEAARERYEKESEEDRRDFDKSLSDLRLARTKARGRSSPRSR